MNYIDLFAGAGGLSEGFKKAGFNPIAHVEMDKNACSSLRTRVTYHYLKEHNQTDIYYQYLKGEISREELYNYVPSNLLESVINTEISDSTIDSVFEKINKFLLGAKIDLIVGGPPCQAYSVIGRARMGKDKVENDVRYSLYKQYARFLEYYQPDYFVFENVSGLLTSGGGSLYFSIKSYFKKIGYCIDYRVLNASQYGVLQERKRIIIFGVKDSLPFRYPKPDFISHKNDWTVKRALFSDLQPLEQGESKVISSYIGQPQSSYLFDFGIRNGVDFVTQHITRPHISRDLSIYKIAITLWEDHKKRLKYKDLPHELITHQNISDFGDRFKVIDPNGFSHTVVAHLHKDGHYYIYPDRNQPRSVSVREAARIQSFPDDYYFEGGRGAAFKQIGNAVPPQLAYEIAKKIKELYFG